MSESHVDGSAKSFGAEGPMCGGRLPTIDGDVVIVHRHSVPAAYEVWIVIEDGQQARHEPLFQPMLVGDPVAAEQLARMFVTASGTVFVVDEASNRWTTIAGSS